MIDKIKNNIAFYAATLNITSSFFFADYVARQWSNPDNASDSIALWLFGASLFLWLLYTVLFFVKLARKTRK